MSRSEAAIAAKIERPGVAGDFATEVERDAIWIAHLALHVPVVEAHAIEDSLADIQNQVRFYRQRDELTGRNVPRLSTAFEESAARCTVVRS